MKGFTMKLAAILMTLLMSLTVVGGPVPQAFFVESFFDEYVKPQNTSGISFVQEGVTVSITANLGELEIANGVICPSDPAAGLSVTLSDVMDQFSFYGPGLGTGDITLLAHLRHKGGTLLQDIPWVPNAPLTGTSFSVNNRIMGFSLTHACIDVIRFDEHGR